MIEMQRINYSKNRIILLLVCLFSLRGICQSGDEVAGLLVNMGFENVSWAEDEKERVYVFENSPYKLSGVGIGKAIDKIQELGLPGNKNCRVIVLDNNVPQISLFYQYAEHNAPQIVSLSNWEVSYDLGDSWKKVKKEKMKNRSLFKVDIIAYPEFFFKNYKLSKVYDYVVNVSPVVEISLWDGMKLATQVVFPVINDDYGDIYGKVRPGFITLTQTVRLPERTFLTASVGYFNNYRRGLDIRAKHILRNERFSIEGRLGYTDKGYYYGWDYYSMDDGWRLTGSITAGFYLPAYNTQFYLKGERYLRGEYGVRGEMMRHFRHASIGFYAMKVEKAGNKGLNGGFVFQIAIPPYKVKRKGYIPRVYAGDFSLKYNGGNEEIYGRTYRSRADDNDMRDNRYNPYFIKSELLNY